MSRIKGRKAFNRKFEKDPLSRVQFFRANEPEDTIGVEAFVVSVCDSILKRLNSESSTRGRNERG